MIQTEVSGAAGQLTVVKKRYSKHKRRLAHYPLPQAPAMDAITSSPRKYGLAADVASAIPSQHQWQTTVFQFGVPNSMPPKSVWTTSETHKTAFQRPISGAGFAPYSSFPNGRTASILADALHPSLLKSTSPLGQRKSTLTGKGVGNQYQRASNDWQIRVRDDRIKAKDKQIADLKAQVECESQIHKTQVEAMVEAEKALKVQIEGYEHLQVSLEQRITTLEGELKEVLDIKEPKKEIRCRRDLELRFLLNENAALRMERQVLLDRTFGDYLLAKFREATADGQGLTRFVNIFYQVVTGPVPHQLIQARNIEWRPFPFMKLPGELRNQIYKQCLVLRRPIELWPLIPPDAPARTTRLELIDRDLKHINVSLLRVSSQVNREATRILYGCNRFRFSDAGGWIILHGFLLNIQRNFQYLTSISVSYPGEKVRMIFNTRPGASRIADLVEERVKADMHSVIRRFGHVGLDLPNGISSDMIEVNDAVSTILYELPVLQSLSVIVQHNMELTPFPSSLIGAVMCPRELVPEELEGHDGHIIEKLRTIEERLRSWNRSIVFIRRDQTHQEQRTLHHDLDDDAQMGRAPFERYISDWGVDIKRANYGKMADWVSYIVDGGEDQTDMELPEPLTDPPNLGRRPFFLNPDYASIFRRS